MVKPPVSSPRRASGIQRGKRVLRVHSRLQKLLQQTAGEGGLPPGCLSAAHAVRQDDNIRVLSLQDLHLVSAQFLLIFIKLLQAASILTLIA